MSGSYWYGLEGALFIARVGGIPHCSGHHFYLITFLAIHAGARNPTLDSQTFQNSFCSMGIT